MKFNKLKPSLNNFFLQSEATEINGKSLIMGLKSPASESNQSTIQKI